MAIEVVSIQVCKAEAALAKLLAPDTGEWDRAEEAVVPIEPTPLERLPSAYVQASWRDRPRGAIGEVRVRAAGGAGGVAVVAHPGRYRMSGEQMHRLFEQFSAAGGEAIEVISGSHGEAAVRTFARLAREFGFHASRASDFHAPGESPVDLGAGERLPDGLQPVWLMPRLQHRLHQPA